MKQVNIFKLVVLVGSALVAADSKILGCYKSTTGMTYKDTWDWQSKGHCGDDMCTDSAAFAVIDHKCYCGDMIPPDSDKVDDSKCNIKCPGYKTEICGGLGGFALVYDKNLVTSVPKAEAQESPSTSSETASRTATPSTATATPPKQTVFVSTSSTPISTSAPSKKSNTAGIAAGVVVGLVAIAAIAGGLFLFMRNRKRRAIEAEHKRNAAANTFVAAGKPPTSSGGNSSFGDNRLDPVMAQRRMSDGSIADNQDYTRRILKVTNY